MRTLSNIGLGVEIDRLRQENKPWTEWFATDGGRLSMDRHDPATWDSLVEQIMYAKLDGLAPMLRGDVPGTKALALLSSALNKAHAPQTIGLFIDTASLGDLVSTPETRVPFDFGSAVHHELIWAQSIEPCLSMNRQRLERTPDGRVPIAWWSINPGVISQGMQRWEQAQMLLDHVSRRMEQQGYGQPAHIVDQPSWPATVTVYAKHAWFNPPHKAWSTFTHNGVTVGVLVPGFRYHSDGSHQIDRQDGAAWTAGLKAMRDRDAQIVYHESFNNIEESAGVYRSDSWTPDTKYLDILRAHIEQTRPIMPPSLTSIFAVHVVTDPDTKHPIPDAGVLISAGGEGRTNADGYVAFPGVPHGPLSFSVHKTGYKDYAGAPVTLTQNTQVEAVLESDVVSLFPPEQGRLHIVGEHFYTEQNALWQWLGVSWFLGFLRYCRGEDVTPDLRWFRANGFNMLRIFGPLPWKETPDYRIELFQFDKLGPFLELLEAHGLRSNWSLGHYRDPGLKAYARQWYEIASQYWSTVSERVNEPHVGKTKPDPITDFAGVDKHGVLTSYGYYQEALDGKPGSPKILDFGTIHTPRDAAWHRKARIAQEIQHATGKPWISDEPAKMTEPGFVYPGGKNDPKMTPAEAVWHGAICQLWTAGHTLHTEEGKWGRVPTPGMLQHTVAEAVRDAVFLKIGPEWQTGAYSGSHMGNSPVDDADTPGGSPIWSYSSVHAAKALAVRCALAPKMKPINGWREVEAFGPGECIVRLER